MSNDFNLKAQWIELRNRLQAKQLLEGEGACLSLRIPGTESMWFGSSTDAEPQQLSWNAEVQQARVHACVYAERSDVGAVALGGGTYGHCLADFGGVLPQVFDEQARHLGPMAAPSTSVAETKAALARGCGNVLLVQDRPVCLGTTALRLALNAELFEKCAKAYVLAVAGGGRVRPLPWIIRLVANRRLKKDEQRAAARIWQGLLPEESHGY
jgi:hypothetical protein